MKLTKLFTLLLLTAKLSMYADIALPKFENKPDTRYYFANVDSFPGYKFFVTNLTNNKTYKIKQSASYTLIGDNKDDNNRLEVYATEKKSNQKTNVFSLLPNTKEKAQDFNIVYIAISFYFDKNNKLNFRQTVMKPDCYGKKQTIPFISFKNPSSGSSMLFVISLLSFLVLLSVLLIGKMKQQRVYV